ncbi:hypothetical protein HMPREF1421_01052 [Helicobacter pylori GAM265BSii]|uniref:Uncharacterized protein n=1 Tax=Helicobacter pylori GAM265BSii TaxID=1159049 RepID=M3R646_HELPX|nr:hypothetical protein HMPREF1421_01052 [Helicobacter pylori GAM265BSii]
MERAFALARLVFGSFGWLDFLHLIALWLGFLFLRLDFYFLFLAFLFLWLDFYFFQSDLFFHFLAWCFRWSARLFHFLKLAEIILTLSLAFIIRLCIWLGFLCLRLDFDFFQSARWFQSAWCISRGNWWIFECLLGFLGCR